MNLCHCCNVLYLIHFHWKLTRFSLYPVVLLLIGLSRTDWNLINLLNGFDCCGIPIVALSAFQKDKKSLEQIWTIIVPMCSEDYIFLLLRDKNIEAVLPLLLEVFFLKFSQRGLILSWKMGASLFKYFFMSISELAPAALLPLPLYYYHQGKERCFFKSSFPLLPTCFTTD